MKENFSCLYCHQKTVSNIKFDEPDYKGLLHWSCFECNIHYWINEDDKIIITEISVKFPDRTYMWYLHPTKTFIRQNSPIYQEVLQINQAMHLTPIQAKNKLKTLLTFS